MHAPCTCMHACMHAWATTALPSPRPPLTMCSALQMARPNRPKEAAQQGGVVACGSVSKCIEDRRRRGGPRRRGGVGCGVQALPPRLPASALPLISAHRECTWRGARAQWMFPSKARTAPAALPAGAWTRPGRRRRPWPWCLRRTGLGRAAGSLRRAAWYCRRVDTRRGLNGCCGKAFFAKYGSCAAMMAHLHVGPSNGTTAVRAAPRYDTGARPARQGAWGEGGKALPRVHTMWGPAARGRPPAPAARVQV